ERVRPGDDERGRLRDSDVRDDRRRDVVDDSDDSQRAPDPPAVEATEDVPRTLGAAFGALDVEPELVPYPTRLQRPEDGGCVRDGALRQEGELHLGPDWIQAFLDLSPLIDGPHRRISIMAAR